MSYYSSKKYTTIAIIFLISASIAHARIRGNPHKAHIHEKNRNARRMHHQTYDHITSQEHPHMHNERKSGSLARPGYHHRHHQHTNGRMMTNPSRTSIRTHMKENMFRKVPSFQTSIVTASSTSHEFQNRIVGGVPAVADEFKFFASLDIGCGGSLIAPNFILTAAHCAGSINTIRIGSNEVESGGSVNSVVTECMHPNYDLFSMANDFMLLKLQSPVDTNTYPTILLNNDTNVPQVNQLLKVIGFGATSEGGLGSSNLLKVDVPANSHQECNRQYEGGIVEEVMFCAGFPSGGKDSCQGDSGGPIFEIRDGQPVQVGVVSFGEGCARPDKSGVYSRVSGAYDWIQDTMKKLNQGDISGCSGGSTGGPDDDSFPTKTPVQGPTVQPTVELTAVPTVAPTVAPTVVLTVAPTVALTVAPTVDLTVVPTVDLTVAPTVDLTVAPTVDLTVVPTVDLTVVPTVDLTIVPTVDLTVAPTVAPTVDLTVAPTVALTVAPTVDLTVAPTVAPTVELTVQPTVPIPAPASSVPTFTNGPVAVAPILPPTNEVPIDTSSSAPSEPIHTEAPVDVSPVATSSPFVSPPITDDSTQTDDDDSSNTDDDGGFWPWW